jgi:hypothetical protein
VTLVESLHRFYDRILGREHRGPDIVITPKIIEASIRVCETCAQKEDPLHAAGQHGCLQFDSWDEVPS